MTYDDPYWQDFHKRNYRREDNWRLPSIMAWDHKPNGIAGEIIDLKRLDQMQREYYSKM